MQVLEAKFKPNKVGWSLFLLSILTLGTDFPVWVPAVLCLVGLIFTEIKFKVTS